MDIRRKGRAQFYFEERQFVWWLEDDVHLRIASDDKRFSVGYLMIGDSSLLVISYISQNGVLKHLSGSPGDSTEVHHAARSWMTRAPKPALRSIGLERPMAMPPIG